ncbi:hypothetical protein PHYSODRAFT_298931 [Phytophthora sojae]|uniref:PiggyBac transposable element-derived protein domain-containing protein n=1 Tax=Phytophthora sojae (strain P6497) TaxID=1094619 RepID=G4Z6W2_PHYSP|nr:hypothetical protein PHYSODRAFT_298931 [Phytophthora sojae]EGZ21018.1 hypothetical protein PHYSODRAFT_298931 [Phytophthora sojae]|eukprot:XP_009523735.1 hypothetical protein PHYSODRAFT_298931 [Phytophthora sojae]
MTGTECAAGIGVSPVAFTPPLVQEHTTPKQPEPGASCEAAIAGPTGSTAATAQKPKPIKRRAPVAKVSESAAASESTVVGSTGSAARATTPTQRSKRLPPRAGSIAVVAGARPTVLASNLELLERANALIGSETSDASYRESDESDVSDVFDDMTDAQRANHREQVLATTADVNVLRENDREIYTRLESDGASDEECDSEDSSLEDWAMQDTQAQDDDTSSADETDNINDDDALLKMAKNRNEIKSWETSGWEPVSGSMERNPDYRGLYEGAWGLTDDILKIAESPIELFWVFSRSISCTRSRMKVTGTLRRWLLRELER